jgi:hypothetical protein
VPCAAISPPPELSPFEGEGWEGGYGIGGVFMAHSSKRHLAVDQEQGRCAASRRTDLVLMDAMQERADVSFFPAPQSGPPDHLVGVG